MATLRNGRGAGEATTQSLNYFLGYGHLGTTYTYPVDGFLFESPIAWYASGITLASSGFCRWRHRYQIVPSLIYHGRGMPKMKISAAVRLFVMLAASSTPMQAYVLADPISEPRTLVARGLPAEAQKIVDEYLRSNPESADGHYLWAEIRFARRSQKSRCEFTEGAKGKASNGP